MKHSHGNSGAYIQKCKFAAKVLGYGNGVVTVEQRNNFHPGDELEIISPKATGQKFTVTKIFDEEGNEREDARLIEQILRLPCPVEVEPGDLLRLRIEE